MLCRGADRPSGWGSSGRGRGFRAALLIACAVAATPRDVRGQFGGGGFGFQQPVGGISIDADGVIRTVDATLLDESVRAMRAAVAKTQLPAGADGIRTVSLAGIMAAVKEAADGRSPIPVDVALLGGLERISHVVVVPEERDILLVGPAAARRKPSSPAGGGRRSS